MIDGGNVLMLCIAVYQGLMNINRMGRYTLLIKRIYEISLCTFAFAQIVCIFTGFWLPSAKLIIFDYGLGFIKSLEMLRIFQLKHSIK